MIQILETMVKVEISLPELRVLKKVLDATRGTPAVQPLSPNEHKVFVEIHKSIADFVDKCN